MEISLPQHLRERLFRHRTNARLAFVLRLASMGLNAALSLVWTRLLLRVMGDRLNGLFLTFQSVMQLGGIGDLGLSGAVCARTAQHLSRGEDQAGQQFLATARGVFYGLAIVVCVLMVLFAPFLSEWFGFGSGGAGSVPALFLAGGVGLALTIVGGYFNALNYAHGNVVWPVIPLFVLTQATFAAQWALASWRAPLWLVYVAGVFFSACAAILAIAMLRWSHPWLGSVRPVAFNWASFRNLGMSAFWFSLCALSNIVYVTTDRILINSGFGPEYVPAYRNNFKLCELAVTILNAASLVALPAILRRLLGADPVQRQHGLDGVLRLQRLQVVASVGFGASYLFFNDGFMRFWLGEAYLVPIAWQAAFALNVAITIAGEMSIQLLPRFEGSALRRSGIICAAAALANLLLSIWAMQRGSILGIAIATVMAQTFSSLLMARFTCKMLDVTWFGWVARSWALPCTAVIGALAIRVAVDPKGWGGAFLLLSAAVGLTLIASAVLGLRWKGLIDEWRRIRTPVSD